jgi:NAD+ kinase
VTARIGLAWNPTIPASAELLERARSWCGAAGVGCWHAPSGDRAALIRELPGTSALVVLGGDGTFLRAAQAVAEVDVPLVGVNLGKVGFLSKAEGHQLDRVLGCIVANDFRVEERMALEAIVHRGGAEGNGGAIAGGGGASAGQSPEVHVGLNDAAVVRGAQTRVVRLRVTIDGSHLATYSADGVIVATPTGSTAYSFSAGGPIVDPTGRNLVVTTVAAYLTAIRSIVVDPRRTVHVEVLAAMSVLVSIDGHEEIPLAVGDAVEVRARERPIRFLEPPGALAFWDLVRQKVQLLPS